MRIIDSCISNFVRLSMHCFLVFVVLNLIMWSGNVLAPKIFWVPKKFFGIDFVKENYQKTQGAIAFYRNADQEPDKSLIVIFGLSSASEGISTEILDGIIANDKKILSLSGAGRNFGEIELYAKGLIESKLQPILAVFAINPFHLMDPVENQETFKKTLIEHGADELFTGWFGIKRSDLRHQIDMRILKSRTNIFKYFGNVSDEKKMLPWSDNTRMSIQKLNSEEQWQDKLREYGNRGYYAIENYKDSENQVKIFANLIRELQNRNAKVLIVWMPEHSRLIDEVPMQAASELITKLERNLAMYLLPKTIDFRNKLDDQYFNDISHMNKKGRTKFSNELGGILLQNLGGSNE